MDSNYKIVSCCLFVKIELRTGSIRLQSFNTNKAPSVPANNNSKINKNDYHLRGYKSENEKLARTATKQHNQSENFLPILDPCSTETKGSERRDGESDTKRRRFQALLRSRL